MGSGRYLFGEQVEKFEEAFSAYCEVSHCVGVSNGLDALTLALMACDIGPGDEVIVPANTFIATWLAVSRVGATPVPVEPDANTGGIDVTAIEKVVSARSVAIIPVHLYGHPAEMDEINVLAKRYNLLVIEDAAQAHGARYRGRRVGSLGNVAAFSFYPAKNLGAMGDGGAVCTSDQAIAERVRILANYGSRHKYETIEIGYNCRLDEIQAAILNTKLKVLDEWNERRRSIARTYIDRLSGLKGLTLVEGLEGAESVWHLFVVLSQHRDQLAKFLAKTRIETQVHYPVPPHKSGAYQAGFVNSEFPQTERIARSCLSLPIGPHLKEKDVVLVCDRIEEFLSIT